MVEFEYQPWKKIVVHEIVELPLQDFLMKSSLGVESGAIGRHLLWVDGFIVEHITLPDTEDVVREKLQGVVHWSSLSFAVLEKFQEEFKVAGNIRIPVVNLSNNPIFRELVPWIRTNFKREKLR